MVKYHLYLFNSEGDRNCILASVKRNPGYFDLHYLGVGDTFTSDSIEPIVTKDEQIIPMIVYFYRRLGDSPKEFYFNINYPDHISDFINLLDNISDSEPSKFYVIVRSNSLGILRPDYDPIDLTIPIEETVEPIFDGTFDDTF